MVTISHADLVFAIALASIAGMLFKPLGSPSWLWPALGALALVVCGLLPAGHALEALAAGQDVYCFLVGMMVLAELGRAEGFFDWLASHATRLAHGSATRLFFLIYALGALVTVFLSNDATAVVLTPAVAAVIRAAKIKEPLPYLYICAFIANAASFVLPISNPANLVIYGAHMPALAQWLSLYFLASMASIAATFIVLFVSQRHALKQAVASEIEFARLTPAGFRVGLGIGATAIVLLAASASGHALGASTLLLAGIVYLWVAARGQTSPLTFMRQISWSILILVAGLFVLVRSIEDTGGAERIVNAMGTHLSDDPTGVVWLMGGALAYACNLLNNLPLGLIAGRIAGSSHLSPSAIAAVVAGIDIGPNLSVTGSLATILWLQALKREGLEISAFAFLKLGALIMPAALVPALGAILVSAR